MHICYLAVSGLMYRQYMFVIMAAILLTALVTIALSSVSDTAHAAKVVIIKKKGGSNMTNATGAGANMTGAGANMTK